MFLTEEWNIETDQMTSLKFFETNKDKNMTYQNLWAAYKHS